MHIVTCTLVFCIYIIIFIIIYLVYLLFYSLLMSWVKHLLFFCSQNMLTSLILLFFRYFDVNSFIFINLYSSHSIRHIVIVYPTGLQFIWLSVCWEISFFRFSHAVLHLMCCQCVFWCVLFFSTQRLRRILVLSPFAIFWHFLIFFSIFSFISLFSLHIWHMQLLLLYRLVIMVCTYLFYLIWYIGKSGNKLCHFYIISLIFLSLSYFYLLLLMVNHFYCIENGWNG